MIVYAFAAAGVLFFLGMLSRVNRRQQAQVINEVCAFRAAPSFPRQKTYDFRSEIPTAPPLRRRYTNTAMLTGNDTGRVNPSAAGEPFVRETPVRHPTRESDVFVPLLQAVVSAVVIAFVAGALAALPHLPQVVGWPVAAFALVLAGGWFWRMAIVTGLLREVEEWTGLDLDDNGVVGAPPQVDEGVILNAPEARQAVQRAIYERDALVRKEGLKEFVRAAGLHGTSEIDMGIAPARRKDYYVPMRDTLLKLGVAAWRNPDQHSLGWILTLDPAAIMSIIDTYTVK